MSSCCGRKKKCHGAKDENAKCTLNEPKKHKSRRHRAKQSNSSSDNGFSFSQSRSSSSNHSSRSRSRSLTRPSRKEHSAVRSKSSKSAKKSQKNTSQRRRTNTKHDEGTTSRMKQNKRDNSSAKYSISDDVKAAIQKDMSAQFTLLNQQNILQEGYVLIGNDNLIKNLSNKGTDQNATELSAKLAPFLPIFDAIQPNADSSRQRKRRNAICSTFVPSTLHKESKNARRRTQHIDTPIAFGDTTFTYYESSLTNAQYMYNNLAKVVPITMPLSSNASDANTRPGVIKTIEAWKTNPHDSNEPDSALIPDFWVQKFEADWLQDAIFYIYLFKDDLENIFMQQYPQDYTQALVQEGASLTSLHDQIMSGADQKTDDEKAQLLADAQQGANQLSESAEKIYNLYGASDLINSSFLQLSYSKGADAARYDDMRVALTSAIAVHIQAGKDKYEEPARAQLQDIVDKVKPAQNKMQRKRKTQNNDSNINQKMALNDDVKNLLRADFLQLTQDEPVPPTRALMIFENQIIAQVKDGKLVNSNNKKETKKEREAQKGKETNVMNGDEYNALLNTMNDRAENDVPAFLGYESLSIISLPEVALYEANANSTNNLAFGEKDSMKEVILSKQLGKNSSTIDVDVTQIKTAFSDKLFLISEFPQDRLVWKQTLYRTPAYYHQFHAFLLAYSKSGGQDAEQYKDAKNKLAAQNNSNSNSNSNKNDNKNQNKRILKSAPMFQQFSAKFM